MNLNDKVEILADEDWQGYKKNKKGKIGYVGCIFPGVNYRICTKPNREGNFLGVYKSHQLKLIKDMDKYKGWEYGALVEWDGTRKILMRCGDMVALSSADDHEGKEGGYYIKPIAYFIDNGFKLITLSDKEVEEALKLLEKRGRLKAGKILDK